MSVYTVLQNEKADQKLQFGLDQIVEKVVAAIGNYIDAIILTGGFGRGEGGVIFENDEYRPVNDLDIIIVASKHYFKIIHKFKNNLDRIASEMKPIIGVKQVDFEIRHTLHFKFARNQVSSYEILNGYKLLWGDINLKSLMPDFQPQNLPLIDGAIYFFNRGSGLLIPALYFLNERKVEIKYRENFRIELDKACIAMGDAILLLHKKYHFSYAERQKRLRALSISNAKLDFKKIKILYDQAISRKLNPGFNWPGDSKMIKSWFELQKIFSSFFLWYEEKRLTREFEGWNAYSSYILKNSKSSRKEQFKKLVVAFLKEGFITFSKNKTVERYHNSFPFKLAVMPLLLFSLKENSLDEKLFTTAMQLFGYKTNSISPEIWRKITIKYLNLFHPGGIIQDFRI